MTLLVEKVVVRYGGVTAVGGVDLALEPGCIASVIGPNGSGKSSLFNAISGMAPMQEGRVLIDGQDMAGFTAADRVGRGLVRTFQTPRFDPRVTVRSAVTCGVYPHLATSFVSSMLRTPATANGEALADRTYDAIANEMELSHLSEMALGELPMGQIRLVEVARAIAAKPKYLLLDEPAAGLSSAEQKVLANAIRRMAKTGIGVLLVEHNFELVKNLANFVLVLNRGNMLTHGTPDEVANHPDVIRVYLGGG